MPTLSSLSHFAGVLTHIYGPAAQCEKALEQLVFDYSSNGNATNECKQRRTGASPGANTSDDADDGGVPLKPLPCEVGLEV